MKIKNTENNLDKIKSAILNVHDIVKPTKNAVIVVGNSGEGKSTLINYLTGNKLYAELIGYPQRMIIKAANQINNIKIGHTNVSETTAPNKCKIGNTTYWDCPGFNDTKGWIQDTSNGFFIYEVFQKSDNVKIVIVHSQENMLGESAKDFLEVLKKLGKLICNIESNSCAISLVLSKAETDDLDGLRKYFSEELLCSHSDNLDEQQKFLLQYLGSNDSNIGIFSLPKSEGPLNHSEADDILSMINSSVSCMTNVKVIISNDSILRLEEAAIDINEKVNFICNQINNDFRKLLRSEIDKGENIHQFRARLEQLNQEVQSFSSNDPNEFFNRYNYFIQNWGLYDRSKDLCQFIELIKFINSAIDGDKFDVASWRSQVKVQNLINILKQKADIITRDDSLMVKGIVIGVTDIIEAVNQHPQFNKIKVFCLDTIYFDNDFVKHGKKFSIIAPNWLIKSNINIDLSGVDASSYLNDAEHGNGQDSSGNGQKGEDGNPGKNGMNSGCFYGKIINKIDKIDNLHFYLNGGKGGNGQNGGNGSNASDFPPNIGKELVENMNKLALFSRKSLGFSDKNGFIDGSIHAIKNMSTFNEQVLEVYDSRMMFSYLNNRGGDAGKGGFGGTGGKAGKLKIDYYRGDVNISVTQNDGHMGECGSHGDVGRGGMLPYAYRGEYIRELILGNFRPSNEINQDSSNIVEKSVVTGQNVSKQVVPSIINGTKATQLIAKNAIKTTVSKTASIITKETVSVGLKAGLKTTVIESGKQVSSNMIAGQMGYTVVKETGNILGKEIVNNIAFTTAKATLDEGTKQAIQEITKNIIAETSKEVMRGVVVKTAINEGSKQISCTLAKETVNIVGKEIVNNIALTTAKTSLNEGVKQVTQEISKNIIKETSKELVKGVVAKTAINEGSKQIVQQASVAVTGEMTKQVIKTTATTVTKEATKTMVKTGASIGGKIAKGVKSLGVGLLIQGGVSILSGALSDGWKEEPYKVEEERERGLDGIIPKTYNKSNLLLNQELDDFSEQDISILNATQSDYHDQIIHKNNEIELQSFFDLQ